MFGLKQKKTAKQIEAEAYAIAKELAVQEYQAGIALCLATIEDAAIAVQRAIEFAKVARTSVSKEVAQQMREEAERKQTLSTEAERLMIRIKFDFFDSDFG